MITKRNNKRDLYESIMRDVAKTVKRHLNEYDEYQEEINDEMFFDALYNYGELTSDNLEEIFDEPIYINGKQVTGLYTENMQDVNGDDYDEIYYSYIDKGHEYESVFYTNMLDDNQIEIIYNFLIDNENPNIKFFNSLQDNDELDNE